MLVFVVGVVILVLDLFAIMGVLRSSASGPVKLGWVAAILLLPFLGMLTYFIIGPNSSERL